MTAFKASRSESSKMGQSGGVRVTLGDPPITASRSSVACSCEIGFDMFSYLHRTRVKGYTDPYFVSLGDFSCDFVERVLGFGAIRSTKSHETHQPTPTTTFTQLNDAARGPGRTPPAP